MTPDQIIQLRHKLGLALAASENGFSYTSANYISQALALLPCETCNGTGKVIKKFDGDACGEGISSANRPMMLSVKCPDCQQHSP